MTNATEYSNLVQTLTKYLRDLKPDTLAGQNYVNNYYKALENSLAPMHEFQSFVNNIGLDDNANKDAALKAAGKYISTLIKGSSNKLNFKLNIAKEEHILNLLNMGVADPTYSIKDILDEFNKPDLVLKELLKNGTFDKLNSKLLQTIKDQDDIETPTDVMNRNGYNAVVANMIKAIKNTNASTEIGKELIAKTFDRLMESADITPMLTIKEFVTKAQEIEGDDVKIGELVNFIKKKSTGNDLNYLINLCKEEHFSNLNRSGHPNPEETIKDIKKYLELPENEIKELLKKGIFDNLESKLLNEIKTSLGIEVQKEEFDLNENAQISLNGLAQYHPIGLVCNDDKYGKVMLVENEILNYIPSENRFEQVQDFVPTDNQNYMLSAIQQLQYNPESEEFQLNENWPDFKMSYDTKNEIVNLSKLDENAEVIKMPLKDVKPFLMESLNYYKKSGVNFNESALIKDADNFLMLLENRNHLVKFNNLKVVRNLNESADDYAMLQLSQIEVGKKPSYFSNGNLQEFGTYRELAMDLSQRVKVDVNSLFSCEIESESKIIIAKEKTKEALVDASKELNAELIKIDSTLNVIEAGSPAHSKLMVERAKIETELDIILDKLKNLA